MKTKTEIFLIILFFTSKCIFAQTYSENLKIFYDNLGFEKSGILKRTLESFDNFLIQNYPRFEDQNQRTIEFLKCIQDNSYEPLNTWRINIKEKNEIVEEFEKSGLRKDLWLYGHEILEMENELAKNANKEIDTDIYVEHDTFKNDTLPYITIQGDTIPFSEIQRRETEHRFEMLNNDTIKFPPFESQITIGLSQLPYKDSLIIKYLESKHKIGGLFPWEIIVYALLYNQEKFNFEDQVVKIILVTDIYFEILHDWKTNE